MARAPEGPVLRGGQVAPGVMQSLTAGKQMRENRILTAMREKGASQRAGIAAKAQVQSAGAAASSRTAVAAMQTQAMDKRAAERAQGAESDRTHQMALVELNDRLTAKRNEKAREYELEDREFLVGKFDELEAGNRDDMRLERLLDTQASIRDAKTQIELAKLGAKSQTSRTELILGMKRIADDADHNRKIHASFEKGVEDRLLASPGLVEPLERKGYHTDYSSLPEDNVETIFLGQLKEAGVSSLLTPAILTQSSKEELLTLYREGVIKTDDLMKARSILNKFVEITAAKAKTAGGRTLHIPERGRPMFPLFEDIIRGPEAMYIPPEGREPGFIDYLKKFRATKDEAGRVYWSNEGRKFQQMQSVLNSLRDSDMKQEFVNGIRSWEGTSGGDAIETLVKEAGLDIDAILEAIKNNWKFDEISIPPNASERLKQEIIDINLNLKRASEEIELIETATAPEKWKSEFPLREEVEGQLFRGTEKVE